MADGAIEQIKQKLDIVQEIGAVVALRQAGKAYKGLCPFHQERTPSFYVFPETASWRCFGCNEGGDLFTFVAKREGLDFRDVLAQLAEKAGINLKAHDDGFEEPSPNTRLRTRLRLMNDAAAIWFNHQLLASSAATHARSYLQGRGISNESIEQFRLGYAAEGDALTRYLREQGYTDEEIVDGGLARRREGTGDLYDYFRQRIIFTIRDGRGQTIGFGGRELGGGHPKYLNTPQTLAFDKSATLYGIDLARDAIRRLDQVVVVEGYVDAVIAHQYGYRNTVACIGSAITPKHVQQIKKLTRNLVLALDPDAAGEAATMRAIEVAQEGFDRMLVPVAVTDTNQSAPGDRKNGRRRGQAIEPQGMIRFEEAVDAEIRILRLPDGVDPDEFIRQQPSAWGMALQAATPLMDFYFETQVMGLDLREPTAKAEAARRLLPLVAQLGDRIREESYVRRLATLLRIAERDVQMELRRYRRSLPKMATPATLPEDALGKTSQPMETVVAPSGPPGRFASAHGTSGQDLELYCLGLLVQFPQIVQDLCAILGTSDFQGTETRVIYSLLTSSAKTLAVMNIDTILATLPEPVTAVVDHLRAQVAQQPALDQTNVARIAKQAAFRLKRLRLHEAITELSLMQREAEEHGDRETVRWLFVQGVRLHSELRAVNTGGLLQS